MDNLRILYVHSLESGPGSLRQKVLEKAIGKNQVYCPDLNTRNFFLFFLFIYIFTILANFSVVIAFFCLSQIPIAFMFLGLLLIVFFFGYFVASRYVIFYLIQRSIEIIEYKLDEYKPNLIIASSLAAVVVLRMKFKKLPLILLSPAQDRFYERMNIDPLPRLDGFTYTVVVHGKHDKIIPIRDSIRLINSSDESRCRLVIVDDDNRLLNVSEENYKLWIEDAMQGHNRIIVRPKLRQYDSTQSHNSQVQQH